MAAQIVDLPTPPFEDAKEIIMKHSGTFKGRGNWTNIFLPIWSNRQNMKVILGDYRMYNQ